MADKKLSGPPSLSTSSPPPQRGRVEGTGPQSSAPPQQNGGLLPQPHSAPSASSSPLRTFGGLVSSVPRSGPEGRSRSSRLWSWSLSSLSRSTGSQSKCRSSPQEEQEALLDLILESQGHRLEDQRASHCLLPNSVPASLCGACSPDGRRRPSVDFYYMLIHLQSDRMEEQRCPLPDLDHLVGSDPGAQEDFFSLIQRVQSKRMDEQRALALTSHTEELEDSCLSHRYHH